MMLLVHPQSRGSKHSTSGTTFPIGRYRANVLGVRRLFRSLACNIGERDQPAKRKLPKFDSTFERRMVPLRVECRIKTSGYWTVDER